MLSRTNINTRAYYLSVSGSFIVFLFLFIAALFPGALFAQCTDADSDGYYYEAGCGTPRDCNDASASIHPGAIETCNSFDDDCDGSLDEGCDTSCDNPEKMISDVRVTLDPNDSKCSSLVWTGNGYGISWEDGYYGNFQIYFARLDSSGNTIGSNVRVADDDSYNSEYPSLIWIGNEYGVAWHDQREGNTEIYFARLDSSGNKIGTDIRVTDDDDYNSEYPSLLWTGSEYGVAWHDYRDSSMGEIYFARLDSSGNKIGSDVRVTYNSYKSYYPSLVWTGSGYGVAWEDWSYSYNPEINFARLDSSGAKIGSDVRVNSNSYASDPSLVWTGSEYGVSWYDYRDDTYNYEIYFARLDSSGTKIGSDVRVTMSNGTSEYSSLVWTGNEYGVSWEDDSEGNDEICLARLDSSGSKIGPDFRVTRNSANSQRPSLVWTGGNYSISWQDYRDDNWEIYFTQIGCCEGPNDIDGDGYCWSDCDADDSATYPGAPEVCDAKDNNCDGTVDNIDADNDRYFDADCPGGNDCNDSDPAIHPDAPEIVCNGIDESCDGTADETPDNDADGYDVCGSGDLLNPDSLERDCNDANPFIHPNAAELCNGFDDDCDGSVDEGCDTICDYPAKLGSDIRVTNADWESYDPSLIWTGSTYGLGWSDNRDKSGLAPEIYFARLDSSGSKIGSDLRVTNTSAASSYASLVWTGSEFGMAWVDTRDGNGEIYFARFDSSGSKIGSEMRITYNSADSGPPALVWTGKEYGVSWSDNRDGNDEIYFARLDSSGNKGSDIRVTADLSNAGNPSLVWTGSEYGVSWYDYRDGNWEIYFAKLDASGTKIGSDIRVTDDDDFNSATPSLVWTGSEYGVSWDDYRNDSSGWFTDIYFARLDSSGNKIGSDVRVTYTLLSYDSSLIWTGSEYGVSWVDGRDGNSEIYFARLDSSGNKLDLNGDGTADDLRITYDPAESYSSSLAWTGGKYGVTWYDYRGENVEIYFAPIECCDDDIDADTFNNCLDCDDNDPNTYPGAVEICDLKDNDCDGTIDEGFTAPGVTTGLAFLSKNTSTFGWPTVSGATSYDTVQGDLDQLRSTKGDFSTTIVTCLEDNGTDNQASDPDDPIGNGQGFYYLTRAIGCNTPGTYNTETSGQIGDRDAEIDASLEKCP